jgi:hypothetical protein
MSRFKFGRHLRAAIRRLGLVGRQSRRKARSRRFGMVDALEGRELLANIIASASYQTPPSSPGDSIFIILLNNSSSSTSGIGTFWLAWDPGKNLLPSPPSSESASPELGGAQGWTYTVTHAGPGDGYGIQFVAISAADDVPPGGDQAFGFVSPDAAAAVEGNSVLYPDTPVLSAVVYPQGPGSDQGHQFVLTPFSPPPPPPPAPPAQRPLVTVTNVTPGTPNSGNPKLLEQQIVIQFSGALDTAEADSVRTYRLSKMNKKGSFAAKNAKVVALKSASYNPLTNTVVLTSKKRFNLIQPLQLVVYGTGPSGLKDAEGRLIDGNEDGQAGGNATLELTSSGME